MYELPDETFVRLHFSERPQHYLVKRVTEPERILIGIGDCEPSAAVSTMPYHDELIDHVEANLLRSATRRTTWVRLYLQEANDEQQPPYAWPTVMRDGDTILAHIRHIKPSDLPPKITNFDIHPVPLFTPQPPYPAEAKAHHLEGLVQLEIIVSPDGLVRDISIVDGEPPFDEPALKTVSRWRFKPVLVDGRAVTWRYKLKVRWELR